MAKVMARGWIGIAEAAALTGLSAGTLRRYERRGWIHSVRTPGGHRRYERRALFLFMEELPVRLEDRAAWLELRAAGMRERYGFAMPLPPESITNPGGFRPLRAGSRERVAKRREAETLSLLLKNIPLALLGGCLDLPTIARGAEDQPLLVTPVPLGFQRGVLAEHRQGVGRRAPSVFVESPISSQPSALRLRTKRIEAPAL